jgi:radical SAM protein (TIGR01212 family)
MTEAIDQLFPWGDGRRYNSYARYFRQIFGERVQKLSIDAGFTCPNRDGTLSAGGCTFCNNRAFNPSYCVPEKSITQQLDEGMTFHEWRYKKSEKYLAYFQAYSNTYAELPVLRSRYEEALRHPKVVGLIIGTRPDCVDEEKLDCIASLAKNKYVAIEYGIESCYDVTLDKIQRGHSFACTQQAVQQTAERGIPCGGHLILGLPGESDEMMLKEASMVSALPLHTLKLHQLQLLKGSLLGEAYEKGEQQDYGRAFEMKEYVSLVCDFLERLSPDIIMDRFAGEVPPRYQAAPERSWCRSDGRLMRNEEVPVLIEQELERRGTWQGMRYEK